MPVQFLELLNPNAYFGFFSKNQNLPTLQLNTEFLSPFEQACIEGNLELIKNITANQDYLKNDSKFLNGLLLCIKHDHVTLFEYLIHQEQYKNILHKHILSLRDTILNDGKINYLANLEKIFIKHNESLNEPLNDLSQASLDVVLEELWAYYHSQLCAKNLNEHLKTLRKTLSMFYQQEQASYPDHLPIDLDSFNLIRSQYSSYEQDQMLKNYANNRFHRAWRLLNPNERWCSDLAENHLATKLIPYQWLIVLMWLAASDNLFSSSAHFSFTSIEERQKIFFERLSLLQESSNISKHIVLCVLAHPFTTLLTQDVLILELEKFLKNRFLIHFTQFSLETLHQLLQHLKNNQLSLNELNLFLDNNTNFYVDFYKEMATKWKEQWCKNLSLQEYTQLSLKVENLLIDHKKTLLECIKQICQHEHSNYHSIGFFQSSKIKSNNPITKDLLFPLS